jgi:predicted dehydrogenase
MFSAFVVSTLNQFRELGIGILGYGFMGKAHSNAWMRLRSLFYPESTIPKLVGVAGRSETGLKEFATRYGYSKTFADWHQMVADPQVEILDNTAPNDLHTEPCIEAAQQGKHVICEKPLARTSEEALRMLEAVRSANVKHMVAFNFRFAPAVRLAWELLKRGRIGKPYTFRGRFLGEWMLDPAEPLSWRTASSRAGSGSVLDLGSHIIDLARYLVGEPRLVFGVARTFIAERPVEIGSSKLGKVENEDSFSAVVDFGNRVLGTIEASRVCAGRSAHLYFEVNGSEGSIAFDLERINELQLCTREDRIHGFRKVFVLGENDPYYSDWFPHLEGHVLGYEATIVNELHNFLQTVTEKPTVEPHGATFEDGYRCALVCDAILQSARTGQACEISQP